MIGFICPCLGFLDFEKGILTRVAYPTGGGFVDPKGGCRKPLSLLPGLQQVIRELGEKPVTNGPRWRRKELGCTFERRNVKE